MAQLHVNAHESMPGPPPSSSDVLLEIVIAAAHEVLKCLGTGFLEEVYERALIRALMFQGLQVKSATTHPASHKGYYRECVAVLLVEQQLIIELKCVQTVSDEYVAQCASRLKLFNVGVGLLINFQSGKVECRRIMHGALGCSHS